MNNAPFYRMLAENLDLLKETQNYRTLSAATFTDNKVILSGQEMLNLSSNDYLGLAIHKKLRDQFFKQLGQNQQLMSAVSSRLLTGNYQSVRALENLLAQHYQREGALVFSSGYHANSGILPAVCSKRSVILADKLVHASLIDGIRLSQARSVRYRHNDYEQLERLIQKYQAEADFVIVVTESVFSMDGDCADLPQLVRLKKQYKNLLLYVDEAHAVGVRGEQGLGYAEQAGCIAEIDFLVGTFGKALASHGAFVICDRIVRDYLINHMRTFIFTTALPPICIEWSLYIMQRLNQFQKEREHLAKISRKVAEAIRSKGLPCPSDSHIIPYQTGESAAAVQKAEELQKKGFYVLPVRPPTVPEGTSRLRISLNAAISDETIDQLIHTLL